MCSHDSRVRAGKSKIVVDGRTSSLMGAARKIRKRQARIIITDQVSVSPLDSAYWQLCFEETFSQW